MSPGARLVEVSAPRDPRGAVIVLHGGASRGASAPVSATQLSVLRMIPIAHAVRRRGHGQLVVQRLLNSRRGWDPSATPLQDVGWAIDQTVAQYGSQVPICLVGHSLGGRAALLSAGRPEVRGVVAMAPWVYPEDDAEAADTAVVVIHGDEDRIASPARSRRVAERLARQTQVSYVTVRGGTHAMLGRRRCFDDLAARCVAWMLLGEIDDPLIRQLAAGTSELEV